MLFCTFLFMKTIFQAVVRMIAVLLSLALRWMSSVMQFVLMENVKMTLPMKMVGLMLMSSVYLSCPMRYCCNDSLCRLWSPLYFKFLCSLATFTLNAPA